MRVFKNYLSNKLFNFFLLFFQKFSLGKVVFETLIETAIWNVYAGVKFEKAINRRVIFATHKLVAFTIAREQVVQWILNSNQLDSAMMTWIRLLLLIRYTHHYCFCNFFYRLILCCTILLKCTYWNNVHNWLWKS